MITTDHCDGSGAWTTAERRAGAFVGDGQFIGDGGATLQRLWDSAPWKMIKGCPGRYIIKHKKSNPVTVGGVPVTGLNARAFLTGTLGALPADVHELQSERCVDPVQVVVFPDAGGVITYCKRPEIAPDRDGPHNGDEMLYVHTLNTASGLRRKLEGLRLDHVLPNAEAPRTPDRCVIEDESV